MRRAVEAAPGLGVTTLTLYAFSADNWRRPTAEVSTLMRLLESFLVRERKKCRRQGVRLALIGRRDRLSPALVRAIEETEGATRGGDRLYLRLPWTTRPARRPRRRRHGSGGTNPATRRLLRRVKPRLPLRSGKPRRSTSSIRTSGEQRLSDFLLSGGLRPLLFTEDAGRTSTARLRGAVETFRRRRAPLPGPEPGPAGPSVKRRGPAPGNRRPRSGIPSELLRETERDRKKISVPERPGRGEGPASRCLIGMLAGGAFMPRFGDRRGHRRRSPLLGGALALAIRGRGPAPAGERGNHGMSDNAASSRARILTAGG